MSGHQPLLFHPGVWFKNFALSSLSLAVGADARESCRGQRRVRIRHDQMPCFSRMAKLSTGLIDIDGPSAAVPHEVRAVVDDELYSHPSRIEPANRCMLALLRSARTQRRWFRVYGLT